MKKIPLSAAKVGSVLAKNVYSQDGTVISNAGTVLTTILMQKMKDRGVTIVSIAEGDEDFEMTTPTVEVDDINGKVTQITDARFGIIPRDEFIDVLYELAIEREHRILLSKYNTSSGRESGTIPAFQTEKPQPVEINTLLSPKNSLGTLPAVFHRLIAVINAPYTSAQDAAAVIATDPALSVTLLRLVNSAFYGLKTKVHNIDRAVSIIGTGQLVMLAMGAVLITAFKGLPVNLVNMQSFWSHSLACGIAAKLIAQKNRVQSPDTYFIAGLLHDLGRLVYLNALPEHSLYMLTEARRRRVSLHSLEEECLGYTHEIISAMLLEKWQCPADLIEIVKGHHTKITEQNTPENCVLPVANLLSHALGYGSSGEPSVLPISPLAWRKLKLRPEELRDISVSLEEQVRALRMLLSNEE